MNCYLCVMSYKTDRKWNEPLAKCTKRLNELGYDYEVCEGYNYKNYSNIKKTHVCYRNFVDIFLVNAIKKKNEYEGFIYIEDDAYLKDDIIIEDSSIINWLGWWRMNNLQKLGSSILYVPKNKLTGLYYEMIADKPMHLDYYFAKFLNKYDIIISKYTQCLEIKHESFNTGKETNHKYMLKDS